MEKLIISLVGITIIFAIAYLLSENRKSINVRIIIAAFFLQFLIAYFDLTLNLGKLIIEKLSEQDDEISAINIDLNHNNSLLEEERKNRRVAICRSAQNSKTSYKTSSKPTSM